MKGQELRFRGNDQSRSSGVSITQSVPQMPSEDDLRAALDQRFKGDRSGACIAAAVIENGTTAQAYFCANAKSGRSLDERTAFEIGSITKTMTAALLAEMIGRGEITTDDPLAKLLPSGVNVPSFNGTHITVGNIVTHTKRRSKPRRSTRISSSSSP